MDIFDILTMLGGLCLFLFGMTVMGDSLERRAGNSLKNLLGKLTSGKLAGFFTGLAVTGVIQSSSATTVMVVGFVNSGLMTLTQAINVIMGANVGTTVTAWILSLGGIDSGNVFVKLLKPSSFTPILALVGIFLYMFKKGAKNKDTGAILLGFATLMFGMDIMSDAVSGLKDVPAFADLFLLFTNPILGVVMGAVLTAIIQSSSASVGILQALSVTGAVSYGAAIPIIMGQNIGTCITAMLSSIGTNKNARRAAVVHLSFNIIGSIVGVILFSLVKAMFAPAILNAPATHFGIAVCHTCFNVLCTGLLLPASGLLEKLVCRIIPEDDKPEYEEELDERLFQTPALALERSRIMSNEMADDAVRALRGGMACLKNYDADIAAQVFADEDKTDHYEDILGTYLVKLSGQNIGADDSAQAAKLLRIIGDFERIADHGAGLLKSAQEMRDKDLGFTPTAMEELAVMSAAVEEIITLTLHAYIDSDLEAAANVEPLEQVIDELRDKMRLSHITRMQQGECSIVAGFVWSDILTDMERCADHCSNIAACIIDMAGRDMNMNLHQSVRALKRDSSVFALKHEEYRTKYSLA